MTEREQELLERQHLLEETVLGRGWKTVIIPALQERMKEMERRVMLGSNPEEENRCRGAWSLLEVMLSEPIAFFGGKREQRGERKE